MPVAEMVSSAASAGTRIGGANACPPLVVNKPWSEIWKLPSRVYWGVAVRHLDLEEPFTFDRDVEVAIGLFQRTLLVQPMHASQSCTTTNLNRWCGLRVGLAEHLLALHGLIQQVFKVCTATLEAWRVDVGQVVRDHFGARLLRHHAGLRRRGVPDPFVRSWLDGFSEIIDRDATHRIDR